jgi:hypothetical protein
MPDYEAKTASPVRASAQELVDNAADWTTDWPGAVVTVNFTRERLVEWLEPILAAAEARGRQQAEQALKEIAAHKLCEDEPSQCYQDSGPYCGKHIFDDHLVKIARAALTGAQAPKPKPPNEDDICSVCSQPFRNHRVTWTGGGYRGMERDGVFHYFEAVTGAQA